MVDLQVFSSPFDLLLFKQEYLIERVDVTKGK